MKKIILVNLLGFLFLFCIIEIISYFLIKKNAEFYMENHNKHAKAENRPLYTQRYAKVVPVDFETFKYMREYAIGDKNKPSILFFGCSFMYGFLNPENETLPYYITQKTGRTTINRGVPGGCILNMFHDLNSKKFYDSIKDFPQPDYIVYLWIHDHLNRVSNPFVSTLTFTDNPHYEVKPDWIYENGELKEIYPPQWNMNVYALFSAKAYHYFYAHTEEEKEMKMLRLFITAKNLCKDKFPKAKFVIIDYNDNSGFYLSEEMKKQLKKENILVLKADDLAGHELDNPEKWRANDKEHPNGKAFHDVANGLIKALNL